MTNSTPDGHGMTGATSSPVRAVADGSVIRAELPADLTAARQARSAIRQALAAWGMRDRSGDAELLASELAANAAEHAPGTPIGLTVRRCALPDGQAGISCEITDTSAVMPQPMAAGPTAERGRGLAIVAALSAASGIRPEPAGKTSWFTLALHDRIEQAARQTEPEPEAGA